MQRDTDSPRKAGTELREIEVTPEMIEAGIDALCAEFPESVTGAPADVRVVRQVFEAMLAVSRGSQLSE